MGYVIVIAVLVIVAAVCIYFQIYGREDFPCNEGPSGPTKPSPRDRKGEDDKSDSDKDDSFKKK